MLEVPKLLWNVLMLFVETALGVVAVLMEVAFRAPLRTAAVSVFVVAAAATSLRLVVGIVFYGGLLVVVWWLVARFASGSRVAGWWEATVGRWVGSRWRKWRLYDRRWHGVMLGAGLAHARPRARDEVPRIMRIRSGATGDSLVVRTLADQSVAQWQGAVETLRKSLSTRRSKVRAVRVFDEPGNLVRVEVAYGPDPLAEPVPALPVPESSAGIDLRRVPVGRTEAGDLWTVSVLLHLLIAGQTGSGKSGVLQGLFRGLAPAIRDGLVVVRAIDPKEGLEFGPTAGMFERFEDGSLEDFARLLADTVTWCEDRGRRMARQGLRMHVPSVEEPLVLVVVDELVDLTDVRGMGPKGKDVGLQIAASLNHLLRKGRAKGFVVIGALTDPRVEVLPMRHLFPYRIGMRLDTAKQTSMVLGEGARERGAFCEAIPTALPGVGFALHERDRDAVRVRAGHVTDADIEAMVAEYAPTPEPAAAA